MATSLRDLSGQIRTLTDVTHPDLALADRAITALDHAARALGSLVGQQDGDQPRHIARRQLVTHELSSACHAAASQWRPAKGRLPDLAGAAADIIGTRNLHLTDEAGWPAAIEMGEIAGHCVDAATRFPPYARVHDLDRVRRTVVALEQVAAFDQPARSHRSLDAAIPIAELSPDLSPPVRVEESAAGLMGALEREARANTLHLYAVIASAAAAESVARYGTALTSSIDVAPEPRPWQRAPSAWRAVQAALIRFDDGSRYASTPPSQVVDWAMRLSDGIDRLTGPGRHDANADVHESAAATRSAAANLGPIASLIEQAVHQWAADGKLFARARSLPPSDRHVPAVVRDQVVIATAQDVSHVQASTRIAQRLSAALASEIYRSAGPPTISREPGLATAPLATGPRRRAFAVDPGGVSSPTTELPGRSVREFAR